MGGPGGNKRDQGDPRPSARPPRADPPSSDTNCPTADEPPPLFSTNCTSDTMMLSSSTEPQAVHTASPRAASSSMSVPPQVRHTRPVMVGPPPAPSAGARFAPPVLSPPGRLAASVGPHSREATGPSSQIRRGRFATSALASSPATAAPAGPGQAPQPRGGHESSNWRPPGRAQTRDLNQRTRRRAARRDGEERALRRE